MGKPTPKQEAFANAIIAGKNPSEAYRSAGYSGNMSGHAISVEAQRILSNPNVSLLIEEGRRNASERAAWSRRTAIERLKVVNEVSYRRITDKDDLRRDTSSAFFCSLDRLNDLTGGDAEDGDRPVLVDEQGNVFGHPGVILRWGTRD